MKTSPESRFLCSMIAKTAISLLWFAACALGGTALLMVGLERWPGVGGALLPVLILLWVAAYFAGHFLLAKASAIVVEWRQPDVPRGPAIAYVQENYDLHRAERVKEHVVGVVAFFLRRRIWDALHRTQPEASLENQRLVLYASEKRCTSK